MKILNKIKSKIKSIAEKIAGRPQPLSFATIYIIKNGDRVYTIQSDETDLANALCKVISYFHKYDDYKIIYNYVEREIYICFVVKKGNEIECTDSLNK